VHGAAELIHATAIAVGERAALILGPPGSGKSDLALRCIATAPAPALGIAHGALLLADDQVLLTLRHGVLWADSPATIRGRMEVRGVGIVEVPVAASACPVALAVDVNPSAHVERLPDPKTHLLLQGIAVPLIALRALEASAPLKLLLALNNPRLRGHLAGAS
jgi:serine kinase of HPr protein (carbohydrate metabolism regulator)